MWTMVFDRSNCLRHVPAQPFTSSMCDTWFSVRVLWEHFKVIRMDAKPSYYMQSAEAISTLLIMTSSWAVAQPAIYNHFMRPTLPPISAYKYDSHESFSLAQSNAYTKLNVNLRRNCCVFFCYCPTRINSFNPMISWIYVNQLARIFQPTQPISGIPTHLQTFRARYAQQNRRPR